MKENIRTLMHFIYNRYFFHLFDNNRYLQRNISFLFYSLQGKRVRL